VIADALPGVERIEHAELHVVGIEQLLLHEGQRGALRAAFRRIGIPARGIGLRLRIGRAFHHALIGMNAVDLEMMLPTFGEIGIELGPGRARRMDVAVRNRGLGRRGRSSL
jgi:hypothetical protein